jgi:hypothetical protein
MDKDLFIKREFLRHTLAILAYRCGKVVCNTPENFGDFKINEGTRIPGEILAHMGDLIDWCLRLGKGEKGGLNSKPLEWNNEAERFFSLLKEFDSFLESGSELMCPPENLLQGPIADALTHTGQIAMLRRIAGSPVKGENYFKAEIVVGRVGREQSDKRFEFE